MPCVAHRVITAAAKSSETGGAAGGAACRFCDFFPSRQLLRMTLSAARRSCRVNDVGSRNFSAGNSVDNSRGLMIFWSPVELLTELQGAESP